MLQQQGLGKGGRGHMGQKVYAHAAGHLNTASFRGPGDPHQRASMSKDQDVMLQPGGAKAVVGHLTSQHKTRPPCNCFDMTDHHILSRRLLCRSDRPLGHNVERV